MKAHELEHVVSQTKKAKDLQDFKVPTVLLARHGETDFNKENRLRGWTDVPLNANGKKDALDLAKKISKYDISKIYASDLDRTRHTAKAVQNAYMIPPSLEFTKSLRPWHQGVLEGQNVDKILPRMRYFVEHPTEKIPEGESFSTFIKRYLTFLVKIMEEAKKDVGPAILLVS